MCLPSNFYGYQWWILPEEKYGRGACNSAGFQDNEKITVLPEYGLVVVMTSTYPEGVVAEANGRLITDYIIPAATSGTELSCLRSCQETY
ncbi:MAG: hypothetical protein ACFFD4_33535 [Candidatus Odinarchaeota archaeon]